MARILRLVEQSGMPDQWAALHLLNIAFQQSRRSKFPDFDFRRVFELIWKTEKAKSGEEDALDEAVQAWLLTREDEGVEPLVLAANLCRAIARQHQKGEVSRKEAHDLLDRFFDAVEAVKAKEGTET